MKKKEVLCDLEDGRRICFVKEVNETTGMVSGYYIHMEYEGIPLIGANGKRIKISQSKIASAVDYNIMSCLRDFDAYLNEDMLKKAFKIVRNYYEENKEAVRRCEERHVLEVYADVVKIARERAKSEVENNVEKKHRKYVSKDNYIEIETKTMDRVMEEVDAGCSKTIFSKSLESLEGIMGKKFVVKNKGRHAHNQGDKWMYRFVVDEDIVKKFSGEEAL